MTCHGVPEYVIVNGRVVVDEGQLKAVQGFGKFVETPTFPPFVYDPSKVADLKPPKDMNGDNGIYELEKVRLLKP